MIYSIAFLETAAEEYELIIEWYRIRSLEAAENFRIAVKEKLDALHNAPDQYKKTYKNFHEVTLKAYPYNIIYIINKKKQQVIISSFYHHKRDPRKKFK